MENAQGNRHLLNHMYDQAIKSDRSIETSNNFSVSFDLIIFI